jgi:nickel transport protein
MKILTSALAATTLLGGLMAAPIAEAHGIWFAQRARQVGLIYGVGADDLDMVKRLPQITHASGYDAEWQPIKASLRVAGPIVVVDSEMPPTVLTAVLDNGTWSKTPKGEWIKKGRDEVPDAVLAERTLKYAVAIQGPLSTPIPPLPQQLLQIVPVSATLPTELGQPLTIKVLFHGKPVAGARVLADFVNDPDAKPVLTAADGSVTIPVRNQGLNVVNAVFVGPSDNPKKIDSIEYLATLSFVLAHAPE